MHHLRKLTGAVLAASTLLLCSVPLRADLFSVHLASSGTGFDVTGTVDTATDTFTINTWTVNPLSGYLTPAGTEFPLTLHAYTLAGFGASVAYDVADNWDGTMSGWGFLLAAGTGVGDLLWDGTPGLAASSFGWGGFRGTNGYTADLGGIGAGTFQYVPTSNGAGDLHLDTIAITPVATPDLGATAALLFGSLACLAAVRRRRTA